MPAAASVADPRLVRNTCILAHVDHGKTSLADHLVASGGSGLLHPKLAGSARFMDHLPEEQRRAITMKSSSVALRHAHPTGVHRVNLIDSPGHADFCSEVSAAARLSDSALIVVDAAKGVRVQTHAALRQAFVERLRLRPCLVLNKLDHLITDLLLSPEDAYARLRGIVAEKTGASRSKLLMGFWGPYCIDKKKKAVLPLSKEATGSGEDQQPMFVEYVLRPLWKVYQRGRRPNSAKWMDDNVVSFFKLVVSPRELNSEDPKVSLHAVMRAWLPLADSVMEMLVECTPDPIAAQAFRVARLMPGRRTAAANHTCSIVAEAELVRNCVVACSASASAPIVVCVSKMFAVPYTMLPCKGLNGEELLIHSESEPEGECFLAFARVFSGVLCAGQKVFVLSPLYDSVKGHDALGKNVQEVELHGLYEMLEQDLRPVPSVAAGHVVAIQGLGQHVLNSATLSSTKNCWPFSSMTFQVSPMLKVAVEPSNPADLGALVKGLKLLNKADPLVVYTVSQRGEHVLAAAGQVHLDRCIKDLQERFAKVQLGVSKPLVSFKETIQGEGVGLMGSMKAQQGFVERTTPNGRFNVRVQVIRLPNALTKVLAESEELLGQILDRKSSQLDQDGGNSTTMLRQRLICAIDSELEAISEQVENEKLERYRKTLVGYLQRIWAQGGRVLHMLDQISFFCLTLNQIVVSQQAQMERKVLKEEIQEGTSLFTVQAHLPVAESSDFSEKLRKRTSGAASAILAFSHWEVIPQDPFFTPKTPEEIEEFGDGSSIGPNLAKKLMNSVRRRKGLHVEEKVVEHGTKQRTLAKKV
ncbi:unnamed protein product [Miscanthus lutarioriparius]|uniref:Tr-type G domain-containing protein n=1 Tax=Miscanthus lutarioriparius TaxID=422564 RepID=A0A811PQQ4_9POAL|nr:unnamed protein product [Miscanthus lutarioriparius]